jgi:aminomethyltransferase
MLRGTPLHPRTQALCESYDWRRWAGYVAASKYELTHDREYWAIRNSAALLDVSPLYKYLITGRDAAKLVNRIITRDAYKCAVGQVLYTTWCDENGQVIDDGTVSRLDEQIFRITAAEPNLRWFQDNGRGLDVEVADVSPLLGAMALQGPNSRQILQQVTDGDVTSLKYFQVMPAYIGERPVHISRTGYTGDLGYEIWTKADDACDIWDILMAEGKGYGITPTGLLALDMARVEAGLLLIDVDYTPVRKALIESQKSSPYELGLGWTVKLDKEGYFIGRRALEAEQRSGSEWAVGGLEIEWNSLEEAYGKVGLPPQVPHATVRASLPIYSGGREAGYATSSCFSPILKRYIALATLYPKYAEPGTELEIEITVEHMRRRARAKVVKTPFFNPERKRK